VARQLQRSQVLLDRRQQELLSQIAKDEGRSVSAVLRSLVDHYLSDRTQELARCRASVALERLGTQRRRIEERGGTYQGDLLADVRAERERQMDEAQRRDTWKAP
jgi:hypothetical protein